MSTTDVSYCTLAVDKFIYILYFFFLSFGCNIHNIAILTSTMLSLVYTTTCFQYQQNWLEHKNGFNLGIFSSINKQSWPFFPNMATTANMNYWVAFSTAATTTTTTKNTELRYAWLRTYVLWPITVGLYVNSLFLLFLLLLFVVFPVSLYEYFMSSLTQSDIFFHTHTHKPKVLSYCR